MRVLVIEPSPPLAALIRKLLEEAGKRVEVVHEQPTDLRLHDYDAVVRWGIYYKLDGQK